MLWVAEGSAREVASRYKFFEQKLRSSNLLTEKIPPDPTSFFSLNKIGQKKKKNERKEGNRKHLVVMFVFLFLFLFVVPS